MADDTSPNYALSTDFLSQLMLASLIKPSSPSSQGPTAALETPTDVLALATNASLIATGFSLVQVHASTLPIPSTVENPQPLPSDWHAGHTRYEFHYTHGTSGKKSKVLIAEQDGTMDIRGRVEGTGGVWEEVKTAEYVSIEHLPFTLHAPDQEDQKERLHSIFVGKGSLSDFGKLIKVRVAQKFMTAMKNVSEGDTQENEQASTTEDARKSNSAAFEAAKMKQDAAAYERENEVRRQNLEQLQDPRVGLPSRYGSVTSDGQKNYGDEAGPPHFANPLDTWPAQPPQRLHAGYGVNDLGPQLESFLNRARPEFSVGGGGMIMDPSEIYAPGPPRSEGYNPQQPPGSRYDPMVPTPNAHPRGRGMNGQPPPGYPDPRLRGLYPDGMDPGDMTRNGFGGPQLNGPRLRGSRFGGPNLGGSGFGGSGFGGGGIF